MNRLREAGMRWEARQTGDGWQLALVRDALTWEPLHAPGYVSHSAANIRQAAMYLNHGYRGPRLSGRDVKILDDIRCGAESLLLPDINKPGKGGTVA